ncbi:MAG: hypothetical protein HOO91_01160 [Bacteroidales bacterium]|nr:hypothetical protein [Bacteroidales bacterium]
MLNEVKSEGFAESNHLYLTMKTVPSLSLRMTKTDLFSLTKDIGTVLIKSH